MLLTRLLSCWVGWLAIVFVAVGMWVIFFFFFFCRLASGLSAELSLFAVYYCCFALVLSFWVGLWVSHPGLCVVFFLKINTLSYS